MLAYQIWSIKFVHRFQFFYFFAFHLFAFFWCFGRVVCRGFFYEVSITRQLRGSRWFGLQHSWREWELWNPKWTSAPNFWIHPELCLSKGIYGSCSWPQLLVGPLGPFAYAYGFMSSVFDKIFIVLQHKEKDLGGENMREVLNKKSKLYWNIRKIWGKFNFNENIDYKGVGKHCNSFASQRRKSRRGNTRDVQDTHGSG